MNAFDQHLDIQAAAIDTACLPTHGGVYLISDGQGRPVLLACAENLRRAVVNRLAPPPPATKTKRADLRQVAARISWRGTYSRFESALVHWRLSRTFDPKGYRRTLAFPPAWFLRADPCAAIPRFTVVSEFQADAARYVGPFAARRDAEEWIHLLEDVFDLCRYYHILEQTPHGQACAYFEMGRCGAPCNGTMPLATYRRLIADALAFSAGRHDARLAVLHEAMRAAAAQLAFEKASAVRATIDRAAAAIKKPEFRHVAELTDCCWLVVQRGGPARRSPAKALVKPFFVRQGCIEAGEPSAMKDLETAAAAWLSRCTTSPVDPPTSSDEQAARCEALWLVAKFLFQGDAAPGLFCRFDRLPETSALASAIRAKFRAGADAGAAGPG